MQIKVLQGTVLQTPNSKVQVGLERLVSNSNIFSSEVTLLFAFANVQKKLVSSKIEHAWHDNMKSFAKMHQKI